MKEEGKLSKEIKEIVESLLRSLSVYGVTYAEPLIDLTVRAILTKVEEDDKNRDENKK